jgi:phosphoglycolate phosphatase
MPNENHKMRLILFDIDGTLISSGGAGEHALKLAFTELYGIDDDMSGIEIAGRTDSGIILQVLRKNQIETTPENIEAYLDCYLRFLDLELPRREGRVLPGILELLVRLQAHPHIALALLTGNVARGAQKKLAYYGLWNFFEFGAFADDDADRNKLGGFAQARALEKYGREFLGADIDVVGDTAHDIACGKVIGARTIAVATGSFPLAKLEESSPDFAFENLGDVEAVTARLGWGGN